MPRRGSRPTKNKTELEGRAIRPSFHSALVDYWSVMELEVGVRLEPAFAWSLAEFALVAT